MIEMVFYLVINLGRNGILIASRLPTEDQGPFIFTFIYSQQFSQFHCTRLAHLLLDLSISVQCSVMFLQVVF